MHKHLLLFMLLLFSFASFAQSQEDELITLKTNRLYVADNQYDTLNFYLDKDYTYGWILLTGSDIDEDSDGDYTDFLLKLNGKVLVDTTTLIDVAGIGSDGKMETGVINVSGLWNKGKNTIILGSTEDNGQSDYVAMKFVEIIYSKRDIAKEINISSALEDQGYEASVEEVHEVDGKEEFNVQKTFYKDYDYSVIVFPADETTPDFTVSIVDDKGKVLKSQSAGKEKYVLIDFSPKKKTDAHIVVKMKGKKSQKHIIDVWIYYKEK